MSLYYLFPCDTKKNLVKLGFWCSHFSFFNKRCVRVYLLISFCYTHSSLIPFALSSHFSQNNAIRLSRHDSPTVNLNSDCSQSPPSPSVASFQENSPHSKWDWLVCSFPDCYLGSLWKWVHLSYVCVVDSVDSNFQFH